MMGHPVLTFALTICGSVVILVAFVAVVAALARAVEVVRTRSWRARRNRTWRAAEREQAAQDRERHTRLIGQLMRDTLLAPMPGDPRGALLATQWAVGHAIAKRLDMTTTTTDTQTGGDAA